MLKSQITFSAFFTFECREDSRNGFHLGQGTRTIMPLHTYLWNWLDFSCHRSLGRMFTVGGGLTKAYISCCDHCAQ